ncbi:metallophosphoesterase [Rhizobium sp. 2YAF20]|uniref:metallophosphoesterase n=1 Tax=Rhizobium sp. 2YAF20 TaxID=3233027 RepID=UPI003F982220
MKPSDPDGATFMVCAGDVMHVRGSIDPEVLNPLQDTIKKILNMGVIIHAIPGNHDLQAKKAELENVQHKVGCECDGCGREITVAEIAAAETQAKASFNAEARTDCDLRSLPADADRRPVFHPLLLCHAANRYFSIRIST